MLGQLGLNTFPSFSVRPPSWESDRAWKLDNQQRRHCDAGICLCPGGREQAEEEGPWELLLCFSCAAEGTHRGCSCMRTISTHWECNDCAGQGTASHDNSEVDNPCTASPAVPELSPSTVVVEMDRRSQSGPIRMRHILRQQRRAREPYHQPEKYRRTSLRQSRLLRPAAPALPVRWCHACPKASGWSRGRDVPSLDPSGSSMPNGNNSRSKNPTASLEQTADWSCSSLKCCSHHPSQ
ncbi:uncharacterized protein LOC135406775 [Pseudopipra pipra]|uniref:uncharacterized protein LOC135406775 n=1 Tax=Pseudopipra pipra TaxID=415032 RepID=UPI00313A05C4